jgi:hypothetical protein
MLVWGVADDHELVLVGRGKYKGESLPVKVERDRRALVERERTRRFPSRPKPPFVHTDTRRVTKLSNPVLRKKEVTQ